MDKFNYNKCHICKIRGYIECNLCENPLFFCSRGHLHTHQQKFHKEKKNNNFNNDGTNNHSNKNQGKYSEDIDIKNAYNSNDPRKVFEQLQKAKMDIECKIKENRFSEAMININKLLNFSEKFYQEDHLFVSLIILL